MIRPSLPCAKASSDSDKKKASSHSELAAATSPSSGCQVRRARQQVLPAFQSARRRPPLPAVNHAHNDERERARAVRLTRREKQKKKKELECIGLLVASWTEESELPGACMQTASLNLRNNARSNSRPNAGFFFSFSPGRQAFQGQIQC